MRQIGSGPNMTDVLIRKKRDISDMFLQKKGHVRTQQEYGNLQAKERGLRESNQI